MECGIPVPLLRALQPRRPNNPPNLDLNKHTAFVHPFNALTSKCILTKRLSREILPPIENYATTPALVVGIFVFNPFRMIFLHCEAR